MTDRELIELAAKAAGVRWSPVYKGWVVDVNGVESRPWRPFTDDGDALRLAVSLRIGLDHNRAGDQQRYVAACRPGCEGCFSPVSCVVDDFEESQRGAATRRAIVRAAAEIGKTAP